MFDNAASFNGDVTTWNVARVTNMVRASASTMSLMRRSHTHDA